MACLIRVIPALAAGLLATVPGFDRNWQTDNCDVNVAHAEYGFVNMGMT